MENLIGTIMGILGAGAVVSVVVVLLKNALAQKNAASWGKTAAKALDGLVVKFSGGEKNAEKLEEVYAPFIEQFIAAFIYQLKIDNQAVKETLKKVAGKQ